MGPKSSRDPRRAPHLDAWRNANKICKIFRLQVGKHERQFQAEQSLQKYIFERFVTFVGRFELFRVRQNIFGLQIWLPCLQLKARMNRKDLGMFE